MMNVSLVTSIVVLCLVTYTYTQQCDQPSDVARFDCHPEDGATQERCEARKCCWKSPVQHSKSQNLNDISVPSCYYPSDFPNYEVTSNVPTDFGQRIQIVKSQTIYIPNEILKLTVDLIYETQQRFRIRIYDPANKRYEVPLQVPVVENKADMTDYNVVVNSKPFSLVVTRKSTGVTL
jgi:lysosomal alpha-glucosidase